MPQPLLATFGLIDWGVLAVYLLIMLMIGVRAMLRERRAASGTQEFFLGGRSTPSWVLAVSIISSMLSAATFVGAPDFSYRGNLTYLILNVGGFVACFLVGLYFVPRLYRAGTVTIYGFLAQRFGETARVGVSCTFLFGRMLASGSRLMLVAIPMCLLLFGAQTPEKWEMIVAILVVGFVGTFYTTFGGIKTVVWVDVIQFGLVVGAAIVTIGLLLYRIPVGVGEIYNILVEPLPDGTSKLTWFDSTFSLEKPFTIWAALTGSLLVGLATYGTDHDFAQRFLIAKSPARGSISVIAAQFLSIGIVSLFMVIGLLLFIYYQRPEVMGWAPGTAPVPPPVGVPAYQDFMVNHMPTVIAGLAVAGLFAVAQGSMDSAINAMASSAVSDLYLPYRAKIGKPIDPDKPIDAPKFAVAALGAIMTLFAIFCALIYDPKQKTFLDFALGILNFALSGMLAVFLTGLFTNRGNNATVIAALLTGIFTTLLMQDFLFKPITAALLGTEYRIGFTYAMPVATGLAFFVCCSGRPSRPSQRP